MSAASEKESGVNELTTRFSYHAPHGDQAARYTELRGTAREFAVMIAALTPASREQALALTKLEECVMWANAAIARRETRPASG